MYSNYLKYISHGIAYKRKPFVTCGFRQGNKIVRILHFSSAGIGEATCKLLAKEGMKVVGCARRKEKIEALAKETGLKIWAYQVIFYCYLL